MPVTNPPSPSTLLLSRIGASTYKSVQDLMNLGVSTGQVSGGVISASGTANAVDVTAGTGFIKATDSNVATLSFFDWSASVALSVPSGTTRYIGVQYNSGSPVVAAKTTDSWDLDTEFPLGVVVNEGGTRYILNIPWITADNATNVIERFDSVGFTRDNRVGGLVLANTGTRNVTVSAGTILARMSELSISAIDTSAAGRFDAYYRDGAGGWTKESSQSQVNNTKYDNGTGTLANITALAYASRWFYIMGDGSLVMLYGRADYTSFAAALNDPVPSSAPDRVVKQGLLIGRFIYQASGASPATTQSAFGTAFTAASVTSASDLSNGVTGSGKVVLDTSPGFTTAANPVSNDGAALGTTALQWSDLFLAEGGVINWDNGDATLTQAGNVVTLAGADFVADNVTVNTALLPDANDGAALGTTALQFSDLFLAEGAVINFDNGDATITQAGNVVTLAGADLKVTTPGNASTSVLTTDGAQTVTGKTNLPIIIASSGTASSTTNSASETNLAVVTIPAGIMGTNGSLHIYAIYKATGTNNTKTPTIRHSTTSGDTSAGTIIHSGANLLAANISWRGEGAVYNSNSASAQIMFPNVIAFGGNSSTPTTGAIDTANISYINFNGATTNSGDTLGVVAYTVVLFPGV